MKFYTILALLASAQAIRLHADPPAKAAAPPVPLSEAKPNAAAGAVDSSKAGVK